MANWTVATLYNRLAEILLEETENTSGGPIDLHHDPQDALENWNLHELNEILRGRIVTDAVRPTSGPKPKPKTAKAANGTEIKV